MVMSSNKLLMNRQLKCKIYSRQQIQLLLNRHNKLNHNPKLINRCKLKLRRLLRHRLRPRLISKPNYKHKLKHKLKQRHKLRYKPRQKLRHKLKQQQLQLLQGDHAVNKSFKLLPQLMLTRLSLLLKLLLLSSQKRNHSTK